VAVVLQDEAVLAVLEPGLSRDQLYEQVARDFRDALARLARGYESDPDKCRDLLQEIHLALWRSFDAFDGRCSLRTWVYRVAHNVAISQVARRRANTPPLISLEDFEALSTAGRFDDREKTLDRERAMDRLFALIQKLKPMDRQIILLYLEGLDAASIGDVTGLSGANVATKIHRIKSILIRQFKKKSDRNDG
jgi:RNA polymerase sigma-70 factor (ECF subfamily)